MDQQRPESVYQCSASVRKPRVYQLPACGLTVANKKWADCTEKYHALTIMNSGKEEVGDQGQGNSLLPRPGPTTNRGQRLYGSQLRDGPCLVDN